MENTLNTISARHNLAFYFNTKNIPNQKFVRWLYEYFENGNRKDFFEPLVFLNLLYKQSKFVYVNSNKPNKVMKYLSALSLTDEQRHVLYFFIINWFGGVNNIHENLRCTLRLIENEFKEYKGNTPENEYYFSSISNAERMTFSQLKLLKQKFDKLETYLEKLSFWNEIFWSKAQYFHTKYFFVASDREREMPENYISILPDNNEETIQFNNWLLNNTQKEPHYNIESQKEIYYRTIKDNPRALEFIEQEIEAIKKYRDEEKGKRLTFGGYYQGYQSVVKKDMSLLQIKADAFVKMYLGYTKGIADAYYLSFLEAQLEQMKHGNLPESNFGRIDWIKDGKEVKGAHSPTINVKVIEPIISYLERINALPIDNYKSELLNNINENVSKAPAEQQSPSRTKQFILNQLKNIDKNSGWEYAFTTETDFNIFLDLLTCHFEYKPYSLPQEIIKLKRDCKTRFAKALNPIHKEFSENPLKSDAEFFKLIKVLNHFKDLSDIEIYQAITR